MDNNINQKNNKFKQIFRYQFVYVALLILMAAAVIMNINTGNVHISPVQIGKIIFLKGDSGTPEYNIIWKIRLPRLCMAAILGGALSLSGFLREKLDQDADFFQKSYSWSLRAWYIIRSQDVCCYYDDIFT